ncbi:MAG: hypothetical protein JWN51_1254 [Phycisphaerales bacterium]|jgi:hypothetical protein|nr:hypothetical protein [Phycisphaerales bacterium]
MTSALANVPAESDILCEGCGYVLNGLPAGANCPECGKPTAESAATLRHGPAWEQSGPVLRRFISTTLQLLLHPTRFYRALPTRKTRESSTRFAHAHWMVASLLLGVAGYAHFSWYLYLGNLPGSLDRLNYPIPAMLVFAMIVYLLLAATTRVAGWLTSLEAGYWGMRLPLGVVLRGLDYHAAHYLPVSIMGFVTTVGYQALLHWRFFLVNYVSAPTYLYVLCGEVIVAAVYLFKTYWIGMKNMMYANA